MYFLVCAVNKYSQINLLINISKGHVTAINITAISYSDNLLGNRVGWWKVLTPNQYHSFSYYTLRENTASHLPATVINVTLPGLVRERPLSHRSVCISIFVNHASLERDIYTRSGEIH